MKGRIIDFSMSFGGKQRITYELEADFREGYEALKDGPVEITVKKWKPRRSKDANAYFHVLVNQIAEVLGKSDDEVKTDLVLRYGAIARDKDGLKTGCMLPEGVDAADYYRYSKWYKDEIVGGKRYSCYLFYKQTHLMDSKEMARLIDGAVQEAKELNIDTDTPEERSRWESLKGAYHHGRKENL